MAIETETHAERFGVPHLVHLVNASVALDTTDAARDVDGVVEKNVIRHDVNLHPRNGLAGRRAFADGREARVVLQNLVVAIHARGRARDAGEPRLIHRVMAVAAIHAQLSRVNGMGKRHGLDRLVASTGVFGRAIVGDTGHHHAAHQRQQDANLQRQPVCPLRKNQ